jgi:hypothetical protein
MAEASSYTSEETLAWRIGKMAATVLYWSEQPVELESLLVVAVP